MNEILHFIKHIIGFCGEHSHPSVLLSGGVFLSTISLYWSKIVTYLKDLF